MSKQAVVRTQTVAKPAITPVMSGVLQRQCACGQHVNNNEGEDFRQKRNGALQRAATRPSSFSPHPSEVPPIVHEALRSPGQPLDAATRAFTEPHLGHDFSHVRVHTDGRAAESARAVNARAYTVGDQVVFGSGQYNPGTIGGRRLLAHELTHVVQQGGGPPELQRLTVGQEDSMPEREADRITQNVLDGNPQPSVSRSPIVVARDLDVPGSESQPRGVGAGSQSSDQEASTGNEPMPASPQPLRDARIQRIIISCNDMLIALEAVDRTYLYQLSSCQLAPGSYEANVTVDDHDVGIHVHSGGRPVAFRAVFRIRAGQEDPSTLLRDQQTVHVDSVTALAARSPSERECFLPIEDREIIPGDSFDRELFAPIHFSRELWSHRFLLGEFGWITIALNADANVTGSLQGSYGPGILQDICLTRGLGGARVGGHAHFHFPASITGAVNFGGSLSLAARYLSIIPLTSLDGNLDAQGTAEAGGKIDADIQVIHNLRTGRWSLALSSGLALQAALGYRITAAIAAKILTRTVWGASWTRASNVDFGWRGGIAIRPDLSLVVNRGRLESMAATTQSSQSVMGAAATAGASDTPVSSSIITPILTGIANSLLNQNVASVQQDPAHDGLSEESALPLDWHKPKDNFIYPERLTLLHAVSPQVVNRDDGPTQVSYDRPDGTRTFDDIGVADQYWPYIGKTFQMVRGGRSDREKDRFRNLIIYLGYSRSGQQIDHVHELQFGELHPGDALDAFENLWPIDRSANASAGTRHRNQVRRYEQQLGSVQGRYFEIVKIGI